MRLILCLFWCVSLFGRPLEIEVTARSAILMNAETGAILYEKHAHIPSFPASTTKIATALFVLDQKNPPLDSLVTVSAEAVKIKPPKYEGDYPPYWNEVDGTKMGIQKGEVLPIDALLHGMMLISGNDAANAIAESVSGSIPTFMDELNQYLREIGCENTQFQNPHGYHHPEHFTTAYDLCLIAKKALQIPTFCEIVSKTSYQKPKTNKQPAAEIKQFNALLKPGKHYYPKAIGIKTGFHSYAVNTLVAAAEQEGRTLIAVLFGCPTKANRYEDAIRLFEKAFAETPESKRFFGPTQLFTRSLEGAKTVLQASLRNDLTIRFYPAEEPSCKAFVQWETVSLPVKKGQKVGEVHLCNDQGTLLKSGDLFAKEDVQGTFFFMLKQKWNSLFH